jgi:hypothetical protein
MEHKWFYLVIPFFFQAFLLFPAGKQEANTAVQAIRSNELVRCLYRENDYLYVAEYNYTNRATVDQKNIKKLRVGDEKILGFYKIGQAGSPGSTYFIFLNKNSLCIIDGTKRAYTERNKTFEKYEPKEIAANVKNVWFYNNICFYLNSEGKLYFLNAAEKKSYPVEGITFDKDIEYLYFISKNDLLAAIKDSFEEWSEDWISRIDGNNIDTVFKDETQKAYIQRYSKISRLNNPSNTQNADAFEDYDTLVEAVKRTWNDNNEKNNAIIDGLLKKWDIELPSGENKKSENMTLNYLFKYLPQFPENIRKLSISDVTIIPDMVLNPVNQKYAEVFFLVSLHNEAISISSKYKGISANTHALLSDQKEILNRNGYIQARLYEIHMSEENIREVRNTIAEYQRRITEYTKTHEFLRLLKERLSIDDRYSSAGYIPQ